MEREIAGQIEFTREVPETSAVKEMVNGYTSNRNLIYARWEEFGLNQTFIEKQNQTLVGPFVSPAPLPTTYAGRFDNYLTSLALTCNIAQELKSKGFESSKALSVVIEMSEIPTSKGPDALIVPKNKETNQKVAIAGKTQRRIPYGSVSMKFFDVENLTRAIKASFNQYLERFPELKRKQAGRAILAAVIADISQAAESIYGSDNFKYLDFSRQFNSILASRCNPNRPVGNTIAVDRSIYSPFLRYGIKNIGLFAQTLETVGFFENDPNFVKVIGANGRIKFLKVADFSNTDVLLQYDNSDEQVRFSSLKDTYDMAPCKELSYLLCFGSFVPVIYGSENSGGFYAPYATAKKQLELLGFSPLMYRIQPQISDDYQNYGTVFDFYRDIV